MELWLLKTPFLGVYLQIRDPFLTIQVSRDEAFPLSAAFIGALFQNYIKSIFFCLTHHSTRNKTTSSDDAKRELFSNDAFSTEVFGDIHKKRKAECTQPYDTVGYEMKCMWVWRTQTKNQSVFTKNISSLVRKTASSLAESISISILFLMTGCIKNRFAAAF